MRRLVLLTLLALGASVTQASSGMFYFGAGITSSHVNPIELQGFASVFPDLNSTSWQVFAGFRPINLLRSRRTTWIWAASRTR